MKKILVIEDEKHLAEGLRLNLSLNNYQVEIASDGIKGLKVWRSFKPDLIILDLMLPEMDGFKVLEEIRLFDDRVPILILSAKSAVEDKIRCLKKGVDDYMSKPFNLDEFLLRIERVLQRSDWSSEANELSNEIPSKIEFGKCWVDFEQRSALNAEGNIIDLTVQELKLIKVLYQNKGKALSRKFLLENAFGYSIDANSRTIDNFIVRLRKYFETEPKSPQHFKSKRAVGYQFDS
ncbi:MAG: DNA-binding response regulator [Halobacteriovoraceae bacterium]|nr:DNA-binding response regulator [Halobacteriovoraceae bacterium]|tara:strand:- start:9983 stop:10687 length:705 start_codon:yes stop_codon:yes gene_type:complete